MSILYRARGFRYRTTLEGPEQRGQGLAWVSRAPSADHSWVAPTQETPAILPKFLPIWEPWCLSYNRVFVHNQVEGQTMPVQGDPCGMYRLVQPQGIPGDHERHSGETQWNIRQLRRRMELSLSFGRHWRILFGAK